ncbi:hypothetical protein [[Kitasatospora] papulosa]|uniref:hypothetical protein n=1 Tax=[Kitasatospora] papulosa TaxID=1464011 RepID=UPI003628D731
MLDIYWTDVTPVTEQDTRRAEAERVMRSGPKGRPASFSGTPRARHAHNGKDLAS